MRHGAVGHHYLVARGTQEESSRIIQSFHTHTQFESENRLDLKSIREIDGVGELNSNTTITRCLGRYGERGFSHSVEHGINFTDRVVSRRDCLLLVIRVRDHIGKIHVVENALIGCE